MNIELNQFLARFNVKINNPNISATPTPGGLRYLVLMKDEMEWDSIFNYCNVLYLAIQSGFLGLVLSVAKFSVTVQTNGCIHSAPVS